jgi:hypothetical protein
LTEKVEEKSKVAIPAITLSENLLSELCELLDEQYASAKNAGDKYVRIKFYSDGKNKDYTTADSAAFLKNGIQKDLQKIVLSFSGNHNDVSIYLYVSSSLDSNFEVSGTNSMWVGGITKRLEEIFQKYVNSNRFFHKRALALPLSFVIILVASVAGILWARLYYEIEDSSALTLILSSLTSTVGVYWFLGWLYPSIETKHMLRIRARKAIYAAIGAVVVSIIANYIWATLPK